MKLGFYLRTNKFLIAPYIKASLVLKSSGSSSKKLQNKLILYQVLMSDEAQEYSNSHSKPASL